MNSRRRLEPERRLGQQPAPAVGALSAPEGIQCFVRFAAVAVTTSDSNSASASASVRFFFSTCDSAWRSDDGHGATLHATDVAGSASSFIATCSEHMPSFTSTPEVAEHASGAVCVPPPQVAEHAPYVMPTKLKRSPAGVSRFRYRSSCVSSERSSISWLAMCRQPGLPEDL